MSAPGPVYAPPSLLARLEDPALPAIRRDVASRIWHVCAHLAPDERARLVDRIARFTRHWQLRDAPAHGSVAGA